MENEQENAAEVEQGSGKSSGMKLSKCSLYEGEVVSVGDVRKSANSDKEFRFITLDRWGAGDPVTKMVSEGLFQKSLKNVLIKGNFVRMVCDIHVEGVTEYVDSYGEVQIHGSSGEVITLIAACDKKLTTQEISGKRIQADYNAKIAARS